MLLSKVAVDTTVIANALSYWGYAVVTPAFGAFHVRLRSGSVTGNIIDNIASQGAGATNGSKEKVFPIGVSTGGSIYVQVVSGTAPEIVVYYKG